MLTISIVYENVNNIEQICKNIVVYVTLQKYIIWDLYFDNSNVLKH